jgi:hypothetical protein
MLSSSSGVSFLFLERFGGSAGFRVFFGGDLRGFEAVTALLFFRAILTKKN